MATDKAEAMKEEAGQHTLNGSFDKSGNDYRVKGQVNPDRKFEAAIVNSKGNDEGPRRDEQKKNLRRDRKSVV